MSNYSLQIDPTKENIYNSLSNDMLGNNEWIYKCLNILLRMENTVLAFDADWGNGKTFLAKQLQMIINEKWEMNYTGRQESDFDIIPNLNFKSIPYNSYYAIYYNVWEYDNDNDPVVSFLYFLLKELNKKIKSERFNQVATNFLENVIEKISNGWIKINREEEQQTLEKVLSSIIETETIRKEIKSLLDELKAEKFNNLVIIIDELDRCRPLYALKIIEMIKHYLKMENILVVCMTDIKQLSNCISSIYGNQYDSNMYLDKIFDFKFDIPSFKYDKKAYIRTKIHYDVSEYNFFDLTCIEIADYLNLSLRNIDKYLGYIGSMFKENNVFTNEDYTAKAFVDYLFIPYYIGIMLFKPNTFVDFLNGDFSHYFNFCKRPRILEHIKEIYSICLKNHDYDELNLFEYLKHDCDLLVKHIKGNRSFINKYYVNRGAWTNGVYNYIKKIDMIDFFIKNTNKN